VARRPKSFSIRSYREGDEEALSRLFNEYSVGFFGPGPVTAKAWREQFRAQDWNGPSVEADGDCARLAEQDGELLGYAVTDYEPMWLSGGALIQELCVAEGAEAGEIAEALVEDAEKRARERGKSFVAIQLPQEEARAAAGSAVRGYHVPSDCDEVFMAAITDLSRFLSEISEELSRRLGESGFRGWRGTVRVASGTPGCESQLCDLHVADGAVEVGSAAEAPDVSVTVAADALPLLLMGRHGAGDMYLQDQLSVSARGELDAIALLNVLFPRVPAFLPRAQWW
jgi:GNAT superfamily N-acetyltransferase